MKGHLSALPCPAPQMMTEGTLDISRPLCYFPDFSYKANTFIFYAKVIQRIYIKVGEGWLSKELPVQLLPHAPHLLGLSSVLGQRDRQESKGGSSSLSWAHPSWSTQLAGPWA